MFSQIAEIGLGLATGGTGGAAIAGTAEVASLVHSGNATDAARQARVSWTLQMANAGSVLAAMIIVAAHKFVGGNEAPYWQNALGQLRNDMLSKAELADPGQNGWPDGQPDFYTDVNGYTHRQIVAEVGAADVTSSPSGTPQQVYSGGMPSSTSTSSSRPPTQLPPILTTAPAPKPASSSTMWIVVAVVVVLAVVGVLVSRRGGG